MSRSEAEDFDIGDEVAINWKCRKQWIMKAKIQKEMGKRVRKK